jgi:hypothetical protein
VTIAIAPRARRRLLGDRHRLSTATSRLACRGGAAVRAFAHTRTSALSPVSPAIDRLDFRQRTLRRTQVLRPTAVSHMRLTERRADPHPTPPRHARPQPTLSARHPPAGSLLALDKFHPHMRRNECPGPR